MCILVKLQGNANLMIITQSETVAEVLTCSATSWLYRWWACCLLLFLDGT